jgi:hypothetical protein
MMGAFSQGANSSEVLVVIGDAGEVVAGCLLAVLLLGCLMFAVIIPRRVLRSLRSGRVGLNDYVVHRARHPILFWTIIAAAPVCWAWLVSVLVNAAMGAMGRG